MERWTYKGGEVEWKEARKEGQRKEKWQGRVILTQRIEVEMRMAERL